MKSKLIQIFALALAALPFADLAMPAKTELDKVAPLVMDLMKPEVDALKAGKKTDSEVATAALALVARADSEAAKFLLTKGAYNLYVQAGDFDKAIETLKTLRAIVPDMEPQYLANIIASSLRKVPRRNGGPLYQILEETRTLVRCREELKELEAQAKQKADDRKLQLALAEHYAVLGDWAKALDAFAKSADRKAAAAAKAEKTAQTEKEGVKALKSVADYWWTYPDQRVDEFKKSFRRQAARLYQQALAAGAVTGLDKVQVERRIEEAETYEMFFDVPQKTTNPLTPAVSAKGLYCVIDLSAGKEAGRYPVSYLNDVPKGGWTDEYKTTKLVLRRIQPGSYIMGDDQKDESHRVTITKPFYIGVFEVTQKQWELVMGNRPSFFRGTCWAMRPVEKVSYNAVRGRNKGSKWPANNEVDEDSFLGRLRARTKLVCDLPTEGQWEYACRAGTTGDCNVEGDMAKLARCRDTGSWNEAVWGKFDWKTAWQTADRECGADHGTAPAGLYAPNAYGLYDCHGNVWEWCLDDWKEDHLVYGADPVGGASGGDRVRRGGCWGNVAHDCRSAYRFWRSPGNAIGCDGFRLASSVEPGK